MVAIMANRTKAECICDEVVRLRPLIERAVRTFTQSNIHDDQVFSDVLLRLMTGAEALAFENSKALRAYVWRTAKNATVSILRKKCNATSQKLPEEKLLPPSTNGSTVSTQLEVEEQLQSLSKPERLIFQYRVERRSFEEIGRKMGISSDAARQRFSRIAAKLRKLFESEKA